MLKFEYDSLLNVINRQLQIQNKDNLEDIKNQYLYLLSLLTITNPMSNEKFVDKVSEISKIGNTIICYVKNDKTDKISVVGSGTIIYEPKLIRNCKYVGHIEDIVVHVDYRKHGIAKNILEKIREEAIDNNCYKIILNCNENLIDFYKKNNYEQKNYEMSLYL